MKFILFSFLYYFLLLESNKDFQSKATDLEFSIIAGSDGQMGITTQKPLIYSFNEKHVEQNRKNNDTTYFRNENDWYLYFYDQTEGGEKSWSLDHRNPEGIISLVRG